MKVRELLLEFSEKRLPKDIADVYETQLKSFKDATIGMKSSKIKKDQAKIAYDALETVLKKHIDNPAEIVDFVGGSKISKFITQLKAEMR